MPTLLNFFDGSCGRRCGGGRTYSRLRRRGCSLDLRHTIIFGNRRDFFHKILNEAPLRSEWDVCDEWDQ